MTKDAKESKDSGMTAVYLEQQKYAVEKMSNIKKEELTWLRLYLVYLGVLTSGVVKLIIDLPKPIENIENVLSSIDIFYLVVSSSFILFLGLLVYLRHLYFLQKLSSMKWELKLELSDSNIFQLVSWNKFTTPAKGFLVNILIITGTSLMFSIAIKLLMLQYIDPICTKDLSYWTNSIFIYVYPIALVSALVLDVILYKCSLKKQADKAIDEVKHI